MITEMDVTHPTDPNRSFYKDLGARLDKLAQKYTKQGGENISAVEATRIFRALVAQYQEDLTPYHKAEGKKPDERLRNFFKGKIEQAQAAYKDMEGKLEEEEKKFDELNDKFSYENVVSLMV